MLRILSFATLAIVALCFLLGAGIALADGTATRGEDPAIVPGAVNDASRPQADGFEENLAEADEEDIYEFNDYDADVKRAAPYVEPTDIREC